MRQRGSLRPFLSSVLSLSLVVLGLGVAIAPGASAAEAAVGLVKEGPRTILVGGEGSFVLTATNPGPDPAYNVSFRDVLPAGVTYAAGSTSPSTLGEPTIIANKPVVGETTLIWGNVFDINPAGKASLSYDVTTSSVILPVGATFTNTATAYWSSDVREAPTFDRNGVFTPEPNVTAGAGTPATTAITALEVSKSEPSSENELVRGIHGSNGTTYSILVTNNGIKFTNDVTVTDYLPASLEFLQCGGIDNSTPGYEEYPGSGSLASVTPPPGACPTPVSVETVTNPDGRPAGVYTKVTWEIGDMPPGAATTIRYRAGVPLQQNTASFDDRTLDPVEALDQQPSGTCTGSDCPQAANLDNNTGRSTAETAVEASATNYAQAAGSYQGNGVDDAGDPVSGPIAVTADDTQTVTIEDLAMAKTVSPSTFRQGGTATYSVTLRTSEYRSSTGIVITDVLPDGLTYVDGSESETVTAAAPVVNGDGTTSLEFTVDQDIDAESVFTFTYRATMDDSYKSTGLPTVAGDDYTNDVALTASTYPIEAVDPENWSESPEPRGPVAVTDASDATITSGGSTIAKTLGQDRSNPDCATQSTYSDAVPLEPFQVGDIVCFQLRVDFNDGSSTRNAFVQDFLPAGLTYLPDSWTIAGGTITAGDIDFSESARSLTWLLGTPTGDANRYLDAGEVFLVQFAATVTDDSVTVAPDVTGNLMKFGSVDTAGQATTGRDQQDLTLAGSQVAIAKGVSRIESAVTGTKDYSPPKDGPTVRGGDAVTFSVDITNVGTVPVRNLSLGDDLFDGIRCADVSVISDAGVCVSGSAPATGRIAWNVEDDTTLDVGDTRSFTYVVTIPVGSLVDTRFVDTAKVLAYQAESNQQEWTDVRPVGLSDPSWVTTPKVEIAKSGVTSFNGANNNTPNQLTEGERITYTVDVRVPQGTTVAPGSTLTDQLPAELRLLRQASIPSVDDPEVTYSATDDPGDLGPAPDGTSVKIDRLAGRDRVRVTLPAGFAVSPEAQKPALFRLTFTAVLDPAKIEPGDQDKRIRNVATFTGDLQARYDAFVVLPDPLLTKTNSAPAEKTSVAPGDPVTFTITAKNPAGTGTNKHTALYESVLTDVIPAGVIVAEASLPKGCAITGADAETGGGTITCDLGVVAPNATVTVTYAAEVRPEAAGSQVYINTATLTGSTLPESAQVGEPPYVGTYVRDDSSIIRTYDGLLGKEVSPGVAAIGQQTTWTVTWKTDRASFDNPVLTDSLPLSAGAPALVDVTPGSASCAPACGGVSWTPALSSDGTSLTWTGQGTVPANTTVTFTYTAVVADVAGTVGGDVLVNTAVINTSPDKAEAALSIVEPSLTIGKEVDLPDPAPGAPFTYTITVSNEANAPGEVTPVGTAYHVTIEDVVQPGIIVDVDSVKASGGQCADCDPVVGGGTIRWADVDPIAPGESATRTYQAKLRPDITDGEYLNLAAVPSYTSCDPVQDTPPAVVCATDGRTYERIEAETVVSPSGALADLAIVKTPTGSTTPGSEWTFSMAVSNLGPSDAQGAIVVTDTLPSGLTYVSNGPDWRCSVGDQTVTCTLLPVDPEPVGLAAGDDAPPLVITVRTATAPANASYTNEAAVESTTTEDPNLDNNTSRATVTVAPTPVPPDPDPEKPVDPNTPVDPVDPGKPVDPSNPLDPNRPTIQPQKPVSPLPLPETIKPLEPTVVLPAGILTNAKQPVRAVVDCRPLSRWVDKVALTLSGAWVPMGDVRYCDVRTDKNGTVTVKALYPGQVLVKVTYYAKKVPGFTGYTKVKRWVVTPR